MSTARAFRGFRFPAEVIWWAVRWYLQFPISYRDLEAMLADRGVAVDHTTMYRWVQRFAPELEKRLRRHLRVKAREKMHRRVGVKMHHEASSQGHVERHVSI
jgi:transposase-like protein